MSDRIPLLARTLERRMESKIWHLGGLTSDPRVRDDARHDVLARKAAKLQQVDAELGEAEGLLR